VQGRVVKIYDGDTLAFVDGMNREFRVRLNGIDAPERAQSFGAASRKSLAEMTRGKTALIDYYKLDKYGRLVARVSVDGRDVGIEQLRRGMAWHRASVPLDQSAQEAQVYGQAEQEARARRIGIWQENAVPPWKFREANKGAH
jgi:endonuclease YncB( thermonuclease family)